MTNQAQRSRGKGLIIGCVLFISAALAGCGSPPKAPEAAPSTARISPELSMLYDHFVRGKKVDGLLIAKENETLTWTQFWPQQKIPITTREGEHFVSMVVTTGGDNCRRVARPTSLDKDIIRGMNGLRPQLLPLSALPSLDSISCIEPGDVDVRVALIREISPLGYTVELFEDYSTGHIDVGLASNEQINGGGKVDCRVVIDSLTSTVILKNKIRGAEGLTLSAFMSAGGRASFMPPARKFTLRVDDESFDVNIGDDSLTISPHAVSNNLVTAASPGRFPSNVFGLLFAPDVRFRGYQKEPENHVRRYTILTEQERIAFISKLESMGAKFLLMEEQEIAACRIRNDAGLNLITWPTRAGGVSLPILFFSYEGRFDKVRKTYDSIADRPGVMALFTSRH